MTYFWLIGALRFVTALTVVEGAGTILVFLGIALGAVTLTLLLDIYINVAASLVLYSVSFLERQILPLLVHCKL